MGVAHRQGDHRRIAVWVGAKGNDGVANSVAATPGAIGCLDFAYAEQNKLTYAGVINKSGK